MVWIGSYVCGVRAELLNSAECSAAVLSVCESRDELVLVQVARDGTPSEDAARYRHRIGTELAQPEIQPKTVARAVLVASDGRHREVRAGVGQHEI